MNLTRTRYVPPTLEGRVMVELGQQVATLRDANGLLTRRLASVQAVLAAVVRQTHAYEQALQYYADLQSYRADADAVLPAMPILEDVGFKARQVLYKRPAARADPVEEPR